MQSRWQGVFPALWTPTDASGALVTGALADQVRFLKQSGCDGVLALGSTGEFVHLDVAQRNEGLRWIVEAAEGWPVIANCSDVSPRRVAELGRFARVAGAQAISLLPPWFFASPPSDVVDFLVRGAEASGLPLMLYNFPERTGHRLGLEAIAAVCDRVPVVAVKQSGDEFAYHRELAALGVEKQYVLITGADTRMPEAHAMGARGVVSGQSNAIPEWVVGVWSAVVNGEPAQAKDQARWLAEFTQITGVLEFPLSISAGMQARGRPAGEPKAVLSGATRLQLARAIAEAKACLAGAGLS